MYVYIYKCFTIPFKKYIMIKMVAFIRLKYNDILILWNIITV